MRNWKWMFTAALLISVSAAAQQPAESQPLNPAANGPLPTDAQPLSVGSVPQIAGRPVTDGPAPAPAATEHCQRSKAARLWAAAR